MSEWKVRKFRELCDKHRTCESCPGKIKTVGGWWCTAYSYFGLGDKQPLKNKIYNEKIRGEL